MTESKPTQKEITTAKLLGSLLLFTQTFYKIRTGREFELSQPICRESHYITVCKALVKVFNGDIKRLLINIPPRYGKTEMLIHFIAWCLARYDDCNFIYVSYAHALAAKQTATVRQIVTHPEFTNLFKLKLSGDTQAKDNFETTAHGSVYGVGAGGSITGRGAGLSGVERFSGAIIIDDIIKPEDALSDTIRDSRNDWYLNTLQSRLNDRETPIIYIGQRVHEEDLAGKLRNNFDGQKWDEIVLAALDSAGNALLDSKHTKADLMLMSDTSPYVYASQYQQNPQPSGGGIYKPEWFVKLDIEPKLLATFIVGDCAETDKSYNDATAASFFGIYQLEFHGVAIKDLYGLHWIDCLEARVEPCDLEAAFMGFLANCMRHSVQPKQAYIEKKSTGTTLVSVLKKLQGIAIIPIERNSNSGSKISRFISVQPFVSSRQISFTIPENHLDKDCDCMMCHCIEHMRKITANGTHAHDDIADTLADGITLALKDKVIGIDFAGKNSYAEQQFKHAYSKAPVRFS